MQESITKALLFVIALSTSIIAVELIPQHRVNNAKLLCAEYYAAFVGEYKGINARLRIKNFDKLMKMTKSDDLETDFSSKVDKYCASL